MYICVLYVAILYAVERQICVLRIDNIDSVYLIQCESKLIKRLHLKWDRSAQYKDNRVDKIYTEPKAQWNPTNYIAKYITVLLSSPFSHHFIHTRAYVCACIPSRVCLCMSMCRSSTPWQPLHLLCDQVTRVFKKLGWSKNEEQILKLH